MSLTPGSPSFPHDPNGPAATFAAAVVRLAATGELGLAEILLSAHHVTMKPAASDPTKFYELHLTLHDDALREAVEKRESIESALSIVSAFSWKLVPLSVSAELVDLKSRLNATLIAKGLPAVADVRLRDRPSGGTHYVAVHQGTSSWEQIAEIDQILFDVGKRQTAWIQHSSLGELGLMDQEPIVPTAVADRPVVFISYAVADEAYVIELRNHLAPIRRALAEVWTFREIKAGDDHHGEIAEHLQSAAFGILMISARFLASDYVADVELPELMRGNRRVLPVVVGHCDHSEITRTLFAPWGLKPLNEMSEPERDRIYTQLAVALRQAISSSK